MMLRVWSSLDHDAGAGYSSAYWSSQQSANAVPVGTPGRCNGCLELWKAGLKKALICPLFERTSRYRHSCSVAMWMYRKAPGLLAASLRVLLSFHWGRKGILMLFMFQLPFSEEINWIVSMNLYATPYRYPIEILWFLPFQAVFSTWSGSWFLLSWFDGKTQI